MKQLSISLKALAVIFIIGLGLAILSSWLLISISSHKAEEKNSYAGIISPMTEEKITPKDWGVNFPFHYNSFMKMHETLPATPFAGGEPYSKLIRYPALTEIWAGYPFSADYNAKRSHVFSLLDQIETKRNDKEWLNKHGFPAFKGQPGACMNCHSGYSPLLVREKGWIEFNKTPYSEIKTELQKKYGEGIHKSALGSTCSDCHVPNTMELRVTRQAYINAMVSRGYKANTVTGIEASPTEMRSHVCQQCHVEYYFKKDTFELTFPWTHWPKDEAFNIEMIDKYYDEIKTAFPQDWKHKITQAPMIKIQHPETELNSSGVHAKSGVTCADCHMPYERSGARKFTNHNIRSPLFNNNASCQTCHNVPESELKKKVESIQFKTAASLRRTEGILLALIQDINRARKLLAENKTFNQNKTPEQLDAEINKVLGEVLDAHRKSSMRWDFIFSENSTGFHSPQEAQRVLAQAMDLARKGQLILVNEMQKRGIAFQATSDYGKVPNTPNEIPERHPPVGNKPSDAIKDIDKKVQKLYPF